MIITRRKSLEDILHSLRGAQRVFLVACGGCAAAVGVGGADQAEALQGELEEAGKSVTGRVVIDFLCNKALVGTKLARFLEAVDQAEALLVLSCGVGVQVVAAVVDRLTLPAADSISLGGQPGVWRGEERCGTCGRCVLDLTGGICPITSCAKQLLNGACGGSHNGECEVERGRPCGWARIYERLKQLGRMDRLREGAPLRDFSRMLPNNSLRQSSLWALEHAGNEFWELPEVLT